MSNLTPVPAWIADTYNPELLRQHYRANRVDETTILLEEIDLTSFNPYFAKMRHIIEEVKMTGQTVNFSGSLKELYDWKQKHNVVINIDETSDLGAELRNTPPSDRIPMTFGTSFDLMNMSLVGAEYASFLHAQQNYLVRPHDSKAAFTFINKHPMFWYIEPIFTRVRREGKRSESVMDKNSLTNNIRVTSNRGWAEVEVELFRGEEFSFETGGKPNRTPESWHDYQLDVYSKSMDAGVVELAKLIYKYYDENGSLRNGDVTPNGR